MIGLKIRDFLPEADLLAYVDAIVRVYNLEGRRDNKYKARIKILVHEKGAEAMREAVEAEFAKGPKGLALPAADVERIRAYFAPPALSARVGRSEAVAARRATTRASPPSSTPTSRRTGAGLRHRDDLAEADRRHPGRRHGRADGRHRRSRRALFARRDARVARAEPRLRRTSRSTICRRSTTRSTAPGSRRRTPAS